jgi:transcriptional regulator with XRE-family HTH domain
MNVRKLRGSTTADELATAARNRGLNWGTGRISDLEHGRVSPTVQTLVLLAAALGDVRGEPVTLAELVEYDGMIELAKGLPIPSNALQRYLGGAPVTVEPRDIGEFLAAGMKAQEAAIKQLPTRLQKVKMRDVYLVTKETGETEERVAKALGVETWVVNRASALLWKSTVSAERDRRAGSKASNQARGRITRELREELKAVIRGDDQ